MSVPTLVLAEIENNAKLTRVKNRFFRRLILPSTSFLLMLLSLVITLLNGFSLPTTIIGFASMLTFLFTTLDFAYLIPMFGREERYKQLNAFKASELKPQLESETLELLFEVEDGGWDAYVYGSKGSNAELKVYAAKGDDAFVFKELAFDFDNRLYSKFTELDLRIKTQLENADD